MKQLFFVLATIAISITAVAQETPPSTKKSRKEERRNKINAQIKAEEEGVIAFKKHFAVGLKLTTDGYGIFFEKAYSKSVKSAMLYQVEITERKHQKEEKQGSIYANTNPIIFGKVNFFYPVKLGVQRQFLLGNKSNKNGVSITANSGGGLALGLLRAYEVEVEKNGERVWIRYDSEDSLLFRDVLNDPANSGPSLKNGWKHMKVTPGLYLKQGVRFDYGRYNDLLAALEVGVAGEFYAKKIPQMFDNKQKQFFFSAYVSIMFGKRK